MDNVARNQQEYAEQKPVEPVRPAYNFSGNLFQEMRTNANLSQIVGAITPENKETSKPVKNNTRVNDMFWPDDNEAQNPVNKLSNSEKRKNEEYTADQIRDKPHQIDILEPKEVFKFSDLQEETPEATRPRNFNDFFN